MISFTLAEILGSLIYALAFGAIFSALYSLALLVRGLVAALPSIFARIFTYEKILPTPDFRDHIKPWQRGALFDFFSVVLFSLGYILISYFSLDGVIRLYMLIFAFAAFYLSKYAFFDFLIKLFIWIINLFLQLFCILIRSVFSPLKWIVLRIKNRRK